MLLKFDSVEDYKNLFVTNLDINLSIKLKEKGFVWKWSLLLFLMFFNVYNSHVQIWVAGRQAENSNCAAVTQ